MKKQIAALLLALGCVVSCLLSGCGLIDGLTGRVPTTYPNPEDYTAGDAEFEGKVDVLFLYWIDGSVTVKSHKESTVKIEESANKETDETFQVHWKYRDVPDYGNVLYIYYSASGRFDYGDLKKDITVYLPENDDMHVSLTVDSASVDVDMSGFENTMEELAVSTNSGKIRAKIDSAEEVRISGQNDDGVPASEREFSFWASGCVEDLGIVSSYARIDAFVSYVRRADVGTVFADLSFEAHEGHRLNITNSRNDIFVKVGSFEALEIENTDGDNEILLSPDAAFTLTVKEKDRFNSPTVPTGVSVTFDGVRREGNVYTVGDGTSTVTVASGGDISVGRLQEE